MIMMDWKMWGKDVVILYSTKILEMEVACI